jgi:hypothetical protein
VTDAEKIQRAALRLLIDPDLQPLVQAWELALLNAAPPSGVVDPLRLAMAEGDRLRLLWVKTQAEARRRAMEKEVRDAAAR